MTKLVSNYEKAIIASSMLVADAKGIEQVAAEKYIRRRVRFYCRLGYSVADAVEQVMLDCERRTSKQLISLVDDYPLHSRMLSPDDACILTLELDSFYHKLPAKAKLSIKKYRYSRYLYQTVYKYLDRYGLEHPTLASVGNRRMVLEYLYRYVADCIY